MYSKVGIIGLGLIGGSLAKALKNRIGIADIIATNRSEDVLVKAKADGFIDDYSLDIDEKFIGCELVFICTPVDKIYDYALKLTKYIAKDCIVTDVGSTKGALFEKMSTLSDKLKFIGGHPMTGSEKSRYSAAKEHLFENAYYILTPGCNIKENEILSFYSLIENIGAIPVVVSPFEHDYIVAAVSHVPQIIASALVNNVKSLDDDKDHMHLLAAGGFKDTTRIASSSPDMWETICIDNSKEILNVLNSLETVINDIKSYLKVKDGTKIYNYFKTAKDYRDSFNTLNPSGFVKLYEIIIDVLDKPGSIAIITVLFSSNNINIKNMNILNNRERENGVLSISFNTDEERKRSVELLREHNYEVQIKD